jgi:uncharacterized coiled-coil protein SlyX
MEEMPKIRQGIVFLRSLAAKDGFCWHDLGESDLRNCVAKQIANRQNDELFTHRCQVRDLKKAHWPRLSQLEANLARTTITYDACANKARLEILQHSIESSQKAIAGLSQAVQQTQGEKRAACEAKLREFTEKLAACEKEYQDVWHNTPERAALNQAEEELARFKEAVGLTSKEALVEDLAHQQGKNSGARGDAFEQAAQAILENKILPLLAHKTELAGEVWSTVAPEIHILSQVTLGCARAEMDYVVVRQPQNKEDTPVEVLALVEVKRNLNDVAGGFLQRQENLAWFCRDARGYDPALYRTKIFSKGHFDRPAWHEQNGAKFLFAADSFRRFHRDKKTSYFVDNLFFITRRRALLGMSAADYAKFLYHLASDMAFDLDSQAYLHTLQDWLKEKLPCFQTADVLRLYAKHRPWGEQFLVLESLHKGTQRLS